MNGEVSYQGADGTDVWLPLFLEEWVVVPRELVAHEPGLVWCAEHEEADLLSARARGRLAAIEVAGEAVDPDQGAFLVPLSEWRWRAGDPPAPAAEPGAAGAAVAVGPTDAVLAAFLESLDAPSQPGRLRLGGARPVWQERRARRLRRDVRGLGTEALERAREADVFSVCGWIGQLLLAGLNLIVLWATLGWARGAFGSTSGTDVTGGLLLAAVALVVGGASQRLRHGKQGYMAPATVANACGALCLATVAVVMVLAFLHLP